MSRLEQLNIKRLSWVLLLCFAVFGMFALKMFYMQVIRHGYYENLAQEGRQGYRELDARRGQIFAKDSHSGQYFVLATNVTLPTIFIDPYLTQDPRLVADKLAPLLFDEKFELEEQEKNLKLQRAELPEGITEEEALAILKPKSAKELKEEFELELYEQVSNKIRDQIILLQDPEPDIRRSIKELGLPGIEVAKNQILAYPRRINNREETATKLAGLVEIPVERLVAVLEGKNRYTILKRRLNPDIADKIEVLKKKYKEEFKGVGLENKTYRYYPEGSLAAQVLGFTSSAGEGLYGLEAAFNEDLKGDPGVFKAQLDGTGKQITVGDDVIIQSAVDGVNLYLTIDRAIQRKVEEVLKKYVEGTLADQGQVIVVRPQTGEILAMAHYPTFDPNSFWEALETEPIEISEEDESNIVKKQYGEITETYLVQNELTGQKLQLFPKEDLETGETLYERFSNVFGSAVYLNRAVSDIYEPGSVFKAITMSIALDASSVTANTTVNDFSAIKVDTFTIDNALGKHYGRINMTQVLETSNNIGMAFVAREIGRTLFYSYMKDFGLTRLTGIEFNGEGISQIEKPSSWAESELITHAFGQGIAITPLQMVTAFSVLANDGVLMQPHIIAQKVESGKLKETKPYAVRQVIARDTAETIKAMLLSVVDRGQAKKVQIPGYTIAGKTGTSQTYLNGQPLEGAGTTIATFAGFAPVDDPAFVILVKIDKPRTSPWADQTASPAFREIAEYLLDYFSVPPDR